MSNCQTPHQQGVDGLIALGDLEKKSLPGGVHRQAFDFIGKPGGMFAGTVDDIGLADDRVGRQMPRRGGQRRYRPKLRGGRILAFGYHAQFYRHARICAAKERASARQKRPKSAQRWWWRRGVRS